MMARLALPTAVLGRVTWTERQVTFVSLAATLAPFAGIAFLWFLGVIRDRLGALEDRFFATVFFGSGLLFVAMIFVSSALAASTVTMLQFISGSTEGSEVLLFGRAIMYQAMNIYAMKMASVFMLSLSTVWLRTAIMPRPVALLTLAIALILVLVINFSLWIVLVFPVWVLSISLYVLYLNLREPVPGQPNGISPGRA